MRRWTLLLAALLLAAPAMTARADTASLLLDIRPLRDTSPVFGKGVLRPLLPAGGKALFHVDDPASGREIWVSDGTLAGTYPLRDICPGPCGSTIQTLGALGRIALFFVDSEVPAQQLWRSDGTRPGTYPIAGGDLGELRSCPRFEPALRSAAVGGTLYFVGEKEDHGCELWRTDGTAAGTRPVVDLTPDTGYGSFIRELTSSNGNVWFGADGSDGRGLWRSDGTAEGTVLVRELAGLPFYLTAVGPRLFFVAADEDRGDELWVSDGTTGGTRVLTHYEAPRPFPDPNHSTGVPRYFQGIDGILYFLADDVTGGLDLWRSDGTEAGTRRVTAIGNAKPFAPGFGERQIVKIGSRLVFIANDGLTGFQIWSSGGTPQTTAPVSGCPGGSCPTVDPNAALVLIGGKAVFLGSRPGQAAAVWSTDGTGPGTRLVRNLCLGHCSTEPSGLTPLLGQAYFITEGPERNDEVWRTDGTGKGTLRLASLGDAFAQYGTHFQPVEVPGRVLFAAGDERSNAQLWASDGTPQGTHPLTRIAHGGAHSEPRGFVSDGNAVWFSAHNGTNGGLWRSQGTAATTTLLPGGQDFDLVFARGLAFYLAWDGQSGTGLWRSDGTPGGTMLLIPSAIGVAVGLVPLGSGVAAVFQKASAYELWESDGTPAGTRKRFDLPFSPRLGLRIYAVGPELFLVTWNANTFETALWRSDGTAAGTYQIPTQGIDPFNPQFQRLGSRVFFIGGSTNGSRIWKIEGPGGTPQPLLPPESNAGRRPSDLTVFQGALYFFADRATDGPGLWKSDGTAAGTVLLASTNEVGGAELTPFENRLYFTFDDGERGQELWSTDGTPAGTALVRDIVPGPGSSRPSSLAAAGDRLYFAAADDEHGGELWATDGTEAGTRMVQDIAPGAASSQPDELTVAAGRLFFSADDGVHGREPWVLPLGAPGCVTTDMALCLGGRFRVEAFWRDFQGGFGPGRAVSLTADTGYFWFFDPANVEVMLKVLDGQGVNGHHWVFYGALSNVEYTLTVTDTVTGAARRYINPPGWLGSVADTTAFGPLGAIGSKLSTGPEAVETVETVALVSQARTATAACVPSATRLCLQGGRFAVEAEWRDFQGKTGKGMAVPLPGGDTGYFWFFGPDNVEVVLKVLDGRPLNDRFWVFYGALSNVQYTLTVTDTETGKVKKYENPSGRLASVADTGAF